MHILYKVQLRNCFAFLQKREKNSYKIGNSPKCTTLYKVQSRELFLQIAHMIIQSAIERIFSHFSKIKSGILQNTHMMQRAIERIFFSF